jgi:hypothetical protein
LNNLDQEYSWAWAKGLLEVVDENQKNFCVGKFRGAIFNLNFINAEKEMISRVTNIKPGLMRESSGRMSNGKITRTT